MGERCALPPPSGSGAEPQEPTHFALKKLRQLRKKAGGSYIVYTCAMHAFFSQEIHTSCSNCQSTILNVNSWAKKYSSAFICDAMRQSFLSSDLRFFSIQYNHIIMIFYNWPFSFTCTCMYQRGS